MTERFTEIHLPGISLGWVERGEHTAEEMINALRARVEVLRAEVEAFDAAHPWHFQIHSYDGMHVQRRRKEIQRSTLL